MGIFDKLMAKAVEVKASVAASSAAPLSASAHGTPAIAEQPSLLAQPQSETSTNIILPALNEEKSEESDNWDEVSHSREKHSAQSAINSAASSAAKGAYVLAFTENKLHKVDPVDLVWARFYRYRQYFPARCCRPEELAFDSSAPIPTEDEVVVEFLSQVKKSNTCQRDTIPTNNMMPYWAFHADDKEDDADKSCWNTKRVEAMRKTLQKSRERAKDVKIIYETVMNTANQFLELSLKDTIDTIHEGENEDEEEEDDDGANMVLNDSNLQDGNDDNQVFTSMQTYAYHDDSDADQLEALLFHEEGDDSYKEDRTLRVGDTIRYHNMVFGKMLRTTISGFSQDSAHPLMLDDNYVLDLDTFVGKVTEIDTTNGSAPTVGQKRSRDVSSDNDHTHNNSTDSNTTESQAPAKKKSKHSKDRSAAAASSSSVVQHKIAGIVTTVNTAVVKAKMFPLRKFRLIIPDDNEDTARNRENNSNNNAKEES